MGAGGTWNLLVMKMDLYSRFSTMDRTVSGFKTDRLICQPETRVKTSSADIGGLSSNKFYVPPVPSIRQQFDEIIFTDHAAALPPGHSRLSEE